MKVLLSVLAAATALSLTACGGGSGGLDVAGASPATAEVAVVPHGTVTSAGFYQNPAAIRTRYGFDALPATPEGTGSGQLIAIISTYNNPDLISNVATFSAKYGLSNCTAVNTAYTTPAGSYTKATVSHPSVGQGCTIQVVNVDSFGRPSALAMPTASSDWIAESTMDTEWAHAMAPGASILVVQAPAPFVGALSNAANYASTVAGANVVSMSWGVQESSIQCARKPGSTTIKAVASCDDNATASAYWNLWNSMFSGPSTFVAATGDVGVADWPSVQPNVVAVGGTTESGKTDIGWTGSGGGLSVSYKSTAAQKTVTQQTQRAVPDVAYDAGTAVAIYIKPNAATGYPDTACVSSQGAANCGWYGAGGTSAGAPQWAGIAAITNAMRIAKREATTDFLTAVYTKVAAVPANYSTSFYDVTSGTAGTNTAKTGYDMVTGLGVPDASVLVGYLTQ